MGRGIPAQEYRDKVKQYIDLVRVVRGNISWREIGDLTGQAYQNIHNKKIRGSITAAELFQIADVLGAEVKFVDKKTGKILV